MSPEMLARLFQERSQTGVIRFDESVVPGTSVDDLDEELTRRFMRQGSVLDDAGFKVVTDDALILQLPDEPGALAKVAQRFKDTGVNIQSPHILARHHGYTTVALSADDRTRAETLVDRDSIV